MLKYEPYLFPYRWNLADGYPNQTNGLKVFGTFVCGGGSTMGYKLAGYEHLGGVEIDKKVAAVYKLNHKPKFLYVQDIREFHKRMDLPAELFDLDILDGSPPCSSFSMAGNREDDWGKEKKFAEGQALQTLDDLFFEFIKLADKLQPKVIVAENVKGLIQGNAKSYVHKIKAELNKAGYEVQLFLLNAASMGVPQRRERVFFICQRNDLKLPKLKLSFNEKPIIFGEFIEKDLPNTLTQNQQIIWDKRIESDTDFSDINIRLYNKNTAFGTAILHTYKIARTIVASTGLICSYEYPRSISDYELKLIGSFPMDYNFHNVKPQYLIGMSVPPVMTAQIANQINIQWFNQINITK